MNTKPHLKPPVTIIGGSLAGLATALTLAKHNIPSLVLDSTTFPRRKGCGEGLTAAGVLSIKRLLHDSPLPPHQNLTGFTLYIKDKSFFFPAIKSSRQVFNQNPWGVSRLNLDDALFNAAKTTNLIEIYQASRVRSIKHTTKDTFVIEADKNYESNFVVLAGGKSARKLFPYLYHEEKSRAVKEKRIGGSIYISVRESLLASNQVTIWLKEDCEWYITPTQPNRINLAVLGYPEAVKNAKKQLCGAHLDSLLERFGVVGSPLNNFCGVDGFGGRLNRVAFNTNKSALFAIGDAAESMDPIGGMGMTQALLTGEEAGYALSMIINKTRSTKDSVLLFERNHRKISLVLRTMTQVISHTCLKSHSNLYLRGLQCLSNKLPVSTILRLLLP
jgi:flavin-dependent dehydrogenase